jgi:hypothetical protein
MNNSSPKKILPFPKPVEESSSSMMVQIGDERFAIRWDIVDLPPKELVVLPKRATKKAPREGCEVVWPLPA